MQDRSECSPELEEVVRQADRVVGGVEDRTQWLWTIISDEIDRLVDVDQDPVLRDVVKAGFGLLAENEFPGTMTSRFEKLAEVDTKGRSCTYDQARQLWTRGIYRLAHRVERAASTRQAPGATAGGGGWTWEDIEAQGQLPSWIQPVVIDRMVVTYRLAGRAVASATTERVITAVEDGVTSYLVTAYTPGSSSDQEGSVRAVLNCRVDPVGSSGYGQGGGVQEVLMVLPQKLDKGDQCFFSSEVTAHDNQIPLVETQVTCRGIARGGLTMRLQFDEAVMPERVWWYADVPDDRRLVPPPDQDAHNLTWSSLGYVEHTFQKPCEPRAKFGIGWRWA